MLTAMATIIGRVSPRAGARALPMGRSWPRRLGRRRGGPRPQRHDRAELPIRAASPEAYMAAGQEHPMAIAVRPVVERAGIADEVRVRVGGGSETEEAESPRVRF